MQNAGSAGPGLVRASPPPIWFLAICTALGVVGLTALTPILPMISSDLEVSSAAVQQLFSGYLIALAVGQLVWGTLSDRYGRRPVLLIGAALFTVSGSGVFFFDDIQVLALFRFVQGIGAAACMAMARAMVNDAFDRTEAARTISTISMVLSVAPALSLAGAGWLAEAAGWRSAMGVLLVCGLVVLVCGFQVIRETHTERLTTINAGTVLGTYLQLLRNPLFNFWTLASGMQVGIFFCLNSFLAYQYQRNGYSLTEFGLWFSLTPLFYFVGNSFNRAWFVQRGIERAALTGCFLSLLSAVSMLVTQSIGLTHALSLALPSCLFGFANGIIVANTTVGAISAAGRHRGSGTGIVGAWQMATGGIASAIIVAIGGAQNFSIAAIAVIVMACISVGSMLYVFKHRDLSVQTQ